MLRPIGAAIPRSDTIHFTNVHCVHHPTKLILGFWLMGNIAMWRFSIGYPSQQIGGHIFPNATGYAATILNIECARHIGWMRRQRRVISYSQRLPDRSSQKSVQPIPDHPTPQSRSLSPAPIYSSLPVSLNTRLISAIPCSAVAASSGAPPPPSPCRGGLAAMKVSAS